MRNYKIYIVLATIFLLFVNLSVINHYGITWDYHHVFFGGLYHLRETIKPEMENNLPFVEPDPRRMGKTPFGPIMTTLPTSSYMLFYDKLKLLPFDVAYLLPSVIIGTLGITFFYLFISEATNPLTGFIAGLFLFLYPRYFSEVHINFKDTPQAVIFMINIWLFYRLVKFMRIKDLILAVLAFAMAANIKVNAFFILPIVGLWVFITASVKSWKKASKSKTLLQKAKQFFKHGFQSFFGKKTWFIGTYFFLSLITFFLLWAFFWDDPVNHFKYLVEFFKDNTMNMEVLYFGKWFCSAETVPPIYPYGYLAIITPLPILFFIIVGSINTIFRLLKKNTFSLLLILWFFIPLVRYLNPKIGVIDGIRHFEEVIFPLLAIAAIGAFETLKIIQRFINIKIKSKSHISNILVGIVSVLIVSHLSWNIIRLHPYQIAYFNELVGGTRGAVGKFDMDYWGTSQKAAILWLNQHAPPNAKIHIVMTADTAGKYLRPDLLATLNHYGYDQSDYVVVLNRQSFFYRYFYIVEYLLRRKAIKVIEADGVPMTWIFDNSLGQFERRNEWWKGDDPCIYHYWYAPAP